MIPAIQLARPTRWIASFAAALLMVGANAQAQELDVPYVPTPMEIVDKMLDMAQVGRDDVVFDLGCGDGRIVTRAASARGARGTGIDLDPRLIERANAGALRAGVADRAKFVVGDLFEFDFSSASVVTLYLLPDVNEKLRPYLWRQLKVGTRVVSHDYDMGPGWPPEKVERLSDRKVLFYWTIRPEHKAAVAVKT